MAGRVERFRECTGAIGCLHRNLGWGNQYCAPSKVMAALISSSKDIKESSLNGIDLGTFADGDVLGVLKLSLPLLADE